MFSIKFVYFSDTLDFICNKINLLKETTYRNNVYYIKKKTRKWKTEIRYVHVNCTLFFL